MAQLLVRNLPESLVKKLKKRAVEHGLSAEEEHRRILEEALESGERAKNISFSEHLRSMPDFEEDWIFDRKDPRNVAPPRKEQFDIKDLLD